MKTVFIIILSILFYSNSLSQKINHKEQCCDVANYYEMKTLKPKGTFKSRQLCVVFESLVKAKIIVEGLEYKLNFEKEEVLKQKGSKIINRVEAWVGKNGFEIIYSIEGKNINIIEIRVNNVSGAYEDEMNILQYKFSPE